MDDQSGNPRFFSDFDGVLNRWFGMIDPDFDLKVSIEKKLERVQRAIAERRGRRENQIRLRHPKGLRNKIVDLTLADAKLTFLELDAREAVDGKA